MSRQVQSVYRDAYEDSKLHREKVIAKRQKIETLRALLEMWESMPDDHDHEYILALRARLRSAQNQLDAMSL